MTVGQGAWTVPWSAVAGAGYSCGTAEGVCSRREPNPAGIWLLYCIGTGFVKLDRCIPWYLRPSWAHVQWAWNAVITTAIRPTILSAISGGTPPAPMFWTRSDTELI